nr:hypothetical protein [Candidatus Saccharibacteria bacterium]
MRKLLTLTLVFLILLIPFGLSRADELDDVTRKLNEQKRQLSDLEKRKDLLAWEIASASVSLAQVSGELDEAQSDLARIQKELSEREKILNQWETTRNTLIRQFYKQSRISPFELVFSAEDFIDSTRQLQYHQENLNLLRENIIALSGEITTFKENKAKAEKLKNELAALRAQYQASLSYSQTQLSSTTTQLSQVKSSIKNLTARQEQLILEKFAATAQSETVGDREPLSESLPEPGFGSRPAYMVATYGYPHRIGMSQYGAYGRSKKGQTYKEILRAYYKISNANIKNFQPRNNIYIKGCSYGPPPWVSGGWSKSTCQSKGYTWYDGWVNFETYIGRLYEMPSSWGSSTNKGMHALKAQAVAARSYAWAYTNNGAGPICPSPYCQYYKGSDKGGYWEQAVNATKDQVIVVGGFPLKAFYHSTAGGYTISSRNWISYDSWDSGIKDFYSNGKAYEVISGAPWYHTGWGSRTGSG